MDLVKLKREADHSKTGEGSSKFSKDRAPKTKMFKEQRDDGMKELHKARFLRCPLSNVNKWWRHIPATRSQIYLNLPFKFTGSQGKIAVKTIATLHDRAKPLTVKKFSLSERMRGSQTHEEN